MNKLLLTYQEVYLKKLTLQRFFYNNMFLWARFDNSKTVSFRLEHPKYLRSLQQVLEVKNWLTDINNILPHARKCVLVYFEDNLIAISNKKKKLFFYLEDGEVYSLEELFILIKKSQKEYVESKIEFYKKELEKIDSSTLHFMQK